MTAFFLHFICQCKHNTLKYNKKNPFLSEFRGRYGLNAAARLHALKYKDILRFFYDR